MLPQSFIDRAYEQYGVEYPGDNDIVLVNAFIAGADAVYKELFPEIERWKAACKRAGNCGHGALQTEIEELKDKLAAANVELNIYKTVKKV